mgnify:CR=1 FL=1
MFKSEMPRKQYLFVESSSRLDAGEVEFISKAHDMFVRVVIVALVAAAAAIVWFLNNPAAQAAVRAYLAS